MGMGIPYIRNDFQLIENHLVVVFVQTFFSALKTTLLYFTYALVERLSENVLDLLQFRFREPGIAEALQGVRDLLGSADADEDGGDAFVA